MYNRYIRNDQGTYTRIPEEEPRHTQGGTSPSGQPEHPPSGGGQQPPHWDSAPPPRPDPPPSGENGPDSLSSLLRHLLDQFHLSSVDSGDLLLLAILFFLFREGADEELLVALGLLLPWNRHRMLAACISILGFTRKQNKELTNRLICDSLISTEKTRRMKENASERLKPVWVSTIVPDETCRFLDNLPPVAGEGPSASWVLLCA